MPKRRDVRRFAPGPYILGLAGEGGAKFPLYGDVPLHQHSHGESFLAPATNRFGGESLYILDAVRFTRGFLEAPERYLRAALEDD